MEQSLFALRKEKEYQILKDAIPKYFAKYGIPLTDENIGFLTSYTYDHLGSHTQYVYNRERYLFSLWTNGLEVSIYDYHNCWYMNRAIVGKHNEIVKK